MDESLRSGRLLVATPVLMDPNFRRTVVLIIEHEPDESTLGLVINRPLELSVQQALSSWADLASEPPVVFQGGPVAPDDPFALAELSSAEEPLAWRALDTDAMPWVGLVDLNAPPEVIAGEVGRFRVFAGYAGWGAGQLEKEIAEGAWYVLPADAGDPFAQQPESLWAAVLRRSGGDLALVATLPDDPTMN